MIGIPGSGKSTWIDKEVDRLNSEHITSIVVSRDYIRKMALKPGEDYFARENAVFAEFVHQINEAMEIGAEEVFVDATHINEASRNKVLSRLKPDPNTILSVEILPVSTKLALIRNANRSGFARVPDSAIINMANNFVAPGLEEFSKHDNYGFKDVYLNVIMGW